MARFEAAKKLEAPAEQPQALMTTDGWIRVNDVEFKKDKQGRWRERVAFVNAPGVYANKERIASLNMENTANELGAKFEVKEKPIKEAQILTPDQEKRLRKKPIRAEMVEEEKAAIVPPPLPQEEKKPAITKANIEDLLGDIKQRTATERAKEEKEVARAKLPSLKRALADVVEATAEDVAAEHANADAEIARRKAVAEDEIARKTAAKEFEFLGERPTVTQREAAAAARAKRNELAKQKEKAVAKKIFEDFPMLQKKKEELSKLLATKKRNSPDAATLREAIAGIEDRMKKLEDAVEYQTSLDAAIKPLTVGGVSVHYRPTREKQAKAEHPATPEIAPQEQAPNIYEHLNELPNVAELRKEDEQVAAIAAETKKKEPAIMRELQKEFGQMQEQLDYNQRLLKKLKEDAGFWKLLFSKETRAKIKHVEGKIATLHEKMDNLVGDRDIGEVIGEELITQEAQATKPTTIETEAESPEEEKSQAA